jgi:PAS domain S-box-containing protein
MEYNIGNENPVSIDALIEEKKRLLNELASLKAEYNIISSRKNELEKMLESIGEGVIAVDLNMRVIFCNKTAAVICGCDKDTAAGRPLAENFNLINAANRETAANPIEKTFHTGQAVGLEHNSVIITPAGEEKYLSATSAPIFNNAGELNGAILVFRDISDRKKMEEELLKVSKLESLGVLAGGIAHNFNNLLTGITGNISYAKFIIAEDSPAQEALNTAEEIVFKAKDLTSQFRTFSGGGAPVKKTVYVSDTIKPAVDFVLRGSKVKASYEINDELWPAEIDEGQIKQLITNLVINAVQAMPGGGNLSISASNELIDASSSLNIPAGKYLKISFKDEGDGIAPENISKIFDPYFSTRQSGSGLGLTASYSIARKHGGIITAESARRQGATFNVLLPVSLKNETACGAAEAHKFIKSHHGHKILVMDDEIIVREVTANLLKHLGYEVHTVKNGSEAIGAYIKAAGANRPFDALILDLIVPGDLGGAEVVKKLRDGGTAPRAVAASGFSNEMVMSKFEKYGFCAMISKPYKIKELDELLQKIIKEN